MLVRFAVSAPGFLSHECCVLAPHRRELHLVTFRAHMAIMLILTLTISAFDPEDENGQYSVPGDYSAVFPLLVVSVFISLMASRDTVFYPTQRSRGDITAVPEVLCRPGMSGSPLVVVHDQSSDDGSYDDDGSFHDDGSFSSETGSDENVEQLYSQNDIENAFEATKSAGYKKLSPSVKHNKLKVDDFASAINGEGVDGQHGSAQMDDLLRMLVESKTAEPKHRRVMSAPMGDHPARSNSQDSSAVEQTPASPPPPPPPQSGNRSRTNSCGSQKELVRIQSFGKIQQHQPSLLDQARQRAASSVTVESPTAAGKGHRRVPSIPSNSSVSDGRHRIPSLTMSHSRNHSRQNSQNSQSMPNALGSEPGALSVDDIQSSFDAAVNEKFLSKSPWSNNDQGSFNL